MKLRLRAEKSDQNQNETTRMMDMDNFPSLPAVKYAEKLYKPGNEWQQVGARKSKIDKKKSTGRSTYMVMARGFQWKVTKQNVIDFFKGIKIVNGEDGINIVKNVAMEAHVVLASKADRKKALTLHNRIFESRAIAGMYHYLGISQCCLRLIVDSKWFSPFFSQSPKWIPKSKSIVQRWFLLRLRMCAK